jgi:hypothetical protein
VVVADTDPTSRTYVGGPFGRVPYRYTSPAMTTSAQALVAAKALLNRVKAVNAQLNVERSCTRAWTAATSSPCSPRTAPPNGTSSTR